MAGNPPMSSYWRGFRDGVPFLVVIIPFAMLFGVLATEAGLQLYETMAFSFVVLAGAAQFTALQLMQENAPLIVVIASALAVNLRVAMYSASITPYVGGLPLRKRILAAYFLVDQTYASSILHFERYPEESRIQRFKYYMGITTPICSTWYLASFVGALLGAQVPPGLGLDFALPIAFLAMIGPMIRTGPHRVAALTAIVLSLCFAFLPYNLGLMVAAVGGMMAGAETERQITLRSEARL